MNSRNGGDLQSATPPRRPEQRGPISAPCQGHNSTAQQASVDAARSLQSPGLLILEAPMGSGKTEAALLAAEELAARFGSGGIFVALPTMATANQCSQEWQQLAQIPDAGRTALNLVHSKAALQPEFRSMMYGRFSGIADDDAGSEVFVSAWFRGRRRAALATHVVGTIDQALFGSLRAKHVMLRQLALTTKVVVLDEIHAAGGMGACFGALASFSYMCSPAAGA